MPASLAYYLHNLDPFVFKIWGFGPRWYGLAYLMGFLGAYLLIKKLNRDGMLRLRPTLVPDLVLNCCIFGVLVGGRLGFVLFYDLPNAIKFHRTPLLWDFSSTLPFWGALRVWDGGMAAHGGIVFTILTLMVFSWRYLARPTHKQMTTLVGGAFVFGAIGWFAGYLLWHDENFQVAASQIFGIGWMVYCGWRYSIPAINVGDAGCMVVPIGLFFGRIANFINGELYGHASNVPWAVKFPSEIWSPTNGDDTVSKADLLKAQMGIADYLHLHWQDLSASQVQAFLANHPDIKSDILQLVGPNLQDPAKLDQVRHAIANYLAVAPDSILPSDMAAWWQNSQGGLHATMHEAFDKILLPRHPSQLYEGLLEGALLFAICWTIGRRWRKDGMASGAFLTFYPIMRIIGEQFRVGDTPVNVGGIMISKGVLYSIPMVLAGAIYWGYFIRHGKPQPWVPVPDEPEEKPDEAAESKPRRLKTS